jgi:hypothetical protein
MRETELGLRNVVSNKRQEDGFARNDYIHSNVASSQTRGHEINTVLQAGRSCLRDPLR